MLIRTDKYEINANHEDKSIWDLVYVNALSGNHTRCTKQNSQFLSFDLVGFQCLSIVECGLSSDGAGGMKSGTELRPRAGCNPCSFLGWLLLLSRTDKHFSKV